MPNYQLDTDVVLTRGISILSAARTSCYLSGSSRSCARDKSMSPPPYGELDRQIARIGSRGSMAYRFVFLRTERRPMVTGVPKPKMGEGRPKTARFWQPTSHFDSAGR